MVKIKKSESFDMLISNARGNSNHRGCPAPTDKEPIWEEVEQLPPKVKPYNVLKIPNHVFIRRQPLDTEPISDFGRRRYAKRPY